MASNYYNRADSGEPKEFEEKVIQVNRVSKKTKGGNKMGFSVLVVVGDRKGRVGVGLGKSADVQSSIRKAVSYAKKHLITVPMRGNTITHEILIKKGAARVFLKPASSGTGVIAGGSVRAVVEAAGVKDILSKVLGTSNKASNVYATLLALQSLKRIDSPVKEVVEKVEVDAAKMSASASSDEEVVKVVKEEPKEIKKVKAPKAEVSIEKKPVKETKAKKAKKV